jgi:phage terminase large subunit
MPTDCVIQYRPRNWAKPLHASFKRWAAIVLHRRAGKSTSLLNHHLRYALDDDLEKTRLNYLNPSFSVGELHKLLRNRIYWHGMPTAAQARLTGAWRALKEISSPVPGIKTNETYMSVRYPNNAEIQIVGLDDPDAKRGPGLSGLSLDEYSQIMPNAFGEVLSKSLADHLGYCVFSGTIKGQDQLYQVYKAAEHDPAWFALWQNIDVSLATESGATITALRQAMEDDRKLVAQGLMTQAEFDQEWYLSHEAAIKGSFYADYLSSARKEGRIGRVPYDPGLPVDTDWDLGIDAMAVWFSQSTRSGEVRLIDYYEDVGGGLDTAIKALRGQYPNPSNRDDIAQANARRARYMYGQHWGPHDIRTTEISTGKTRQAFAFGLGVTFQVTPKMDLDDGIPATQAFMSRCYWDEPNCVIGLNRLLNYRRRYDQRYGVFTATPIHDLNSHGADALRGLAVRHRPPVDKSSAVKPKPRRPEAASYMGS